MNLLNKNGNIFQEQINTTYQRYGLEIVELINGLLEEGISKYVALIRHSVREIDSEKDDLFCGLTQEGEAAALEVGKALNPAIPICFYSSFVGRSIDAAKMIGQGYRSIGGKVKYNIVHDKLSGFYLKNKPEVMRIIKEMEDMGSYHSFYQDWFDGKLSTDIIMEGRKAAAVQIDTLLKLYSSNSDCGHICVSHDQNLYLMNHYFLEICPEKHPKIGFMDGVVVYEKDGKLYITSNYCGTKQLELAAWEGDTYD